MRYLRIVLVLGCIGCGNSNEKQPMDSVGVLSNCTGEWPAEWAAKERAVIDQVNAVRAQGGTCNGVAFGPVQACAVDPALTRLSRCFASQQALAGAGALTGSLADDLLRDSVEASGYPGTLTGYEGDIVAATPEEVMAGILGDPAQCEALFDPQTNVGAIGYVSYPEGNVPHRWAGVTASVTQ